MSIGPVVLRPRSPPFLMVVAGLLAAFFVAQGLIVDRWMAWLSLAIAAVFIGGGAWFWFQARRSVVLIDAEEFIVKDGGRERTYRRADVAAVDLSALAGHVRLRDGSTVTLPLEGRVLIEAGVLLSPAPVDD